LYRIAVKFIELWLFTLRAKIIYSDRAQGLIASGQPYIIALWHRDLIYGLYHFRKKPGVIMVSGSKDGEWVARALRCWGQHPIRGSRYKGGKRAIMEMAKYIREKGIGAGIVADGSQGPPKKAQIGALVLSRLTNAPILPLGVAISKAKRLNTWDRLVIPYPFSRVSVTLGDPILVPNGVRGNQLETYRKMLEDGLNESATLAKMSLIESKA